MDIKNIKWIKVVFTFLIIGNLFSCVEDADNYKDNPYILNSDIGLQYENMSTYSYQELLKSEKPSFNIDKSQYAFSLLTIKKGGATITTGVSIFTIDPATGVVTIDNKNAGLTPGEIYSFDIGIGNVNGIIRNNDAFSLEIYDTPLNYTISNSTYDAKYLEVADIATVTYVDTSENGDVLSDITYSLSNPPAGFSINSTTGVISKNTDATSGVHDISVTINSNIGPKTFSNVLKVTVGDAPSLTYVKADNTTPLTNVVLSPWTAYASSAPQMVGMNAVSYEIILPETLTAGSVIANNDGTITVLVDQNLPIGTHSLGVIATNIAGISASFDNIFTLTVETRWETTDLFNDTFDDDLTGPIDPGNTLYPDFAGYTLGTINSWNKAIIEKAGSPTIQGVRVQNPGTDHHYLVRTVDITGVKAMKISFGEQWGYNDKFATETYQRALYAGESTSDLESGSFNPASWTEIMGKTDTRWPGSSTWSSRIPNPIDNIAVDLSAISGNTLKLAWYIGGDTAQNGQYAIDYCNAQVSVAFTAEEQ
ncbi:hypothetical protein EC396_17375 [Lutibacter sp. HS1-25]|uniref:hypothetical protein n=1 Tax=Lutibacter sp. HS1-25 TaxID=2485000 RepID=UPI00101291B5|nr:hypothetical protein [Lutibacter sp. HS1-25]RXP44528.1 hypothetical protein EC396_17375 [Lutibacter sp. HS1-25]